MKVYIAGGISLAFIRTLAVLNSYQTHFGLYDEERQKEIEAREGL